MIPLAFTANADNGSVQVECSDSRVAWFTSDWSNLVTFLLGDHKSDMAVVYNLDHFVSTIAAVFPKDIQAKLQQDGRFYLANGEKVYYQHNRMLGITYGGQEVNIYGVNRYADSPITDCQALLQFATALMDAFKVFHITPNRLTSPVAVYGDVLARLDWPRACDLPDEALPMLNDCLEIQTKMEWREVYQLGHWNKGEAQDYDLHAAYPSVVARLPDISKARFFSSQTLPEKYDWGTLHGKLHIAKPVSPFSHDGNYPVGEWPDIITTTQYWLLNQHHIGTFDIEYGNFFALPDKPRYPFYNTMKELYVARSNANALVAKIAKGISVGVYGRFAQTYDDGNLAEDFNSIYAAMTTGKCAVKVADFIYGNAAGNDVISVMVDGCLLTKDITVPENGDMGTWRRNPESPVLVASLLYQWLNDKKPNGMVYDEMADMIRKNPKSSVYGDIDLNLLEWSRQFPQRPHTGTGLMTNHYMSAPVEVHL